MELILHIGMGKTGTSSIQKALEDNTANLRAQGIEYLGMWFDLLDPSLRNDDIQRDFFHASAGNAENLAHQYITALTARQQSTGLSKFILSNESLLQQTQEFLSFVAELAKKINVKLIMYARDPRDWLPSAYNQWFINHKTSQGAIPSFAVGGNLLLSMYENLASWRREFGEKAVIRYFSKSTNVVTDLASFLNVIIAVPSERKQERVETSESILRAIYNNRFSGQVLPQKFNRAFHNINLSNSCNIDELLHESFNYSEASAIVENRIDLFSEIKLLSGIDLLASPPPSQQAISGDDIRNRVLEHVLQIVMQQADRITHLEHRLHEMDKKESSKS